MKIMKQSSIFLKICLRPVTGWKAKGVTGIPGFRNELTPDQPWGKNWPSAQYFLLMKKRPAIMMNTHTARFSTLRMLLKPTEFFTPSETMMVTMTAITRARKSGYDSSPLPRGERHELIMSRGIEGHANSQPRPGSSALCSEKGGQFVMARGETLCVSTHMCACTVVYKYLFAHVQVLVYR